MTPISLELEAETTERTQHQWGVSHRMAMASMTWRATCGNGSRIGTTRITTGRYPQTILHLTHQALQLHQQSGGFCAAGLGTAVRGPCVRRTASRSDPRSGATSLGSVVPGKFPLNPFSLYWGGAPGENFGRQRLRSRRLRNHLVPSTTLLSWVVPRVSFKSSFSTRYTFSSPSNLATPSGPESSHPIRSHIMASNLFRKLSLATCAER